MNRHFRQFFSVFELISQTLLIKVISLFYLFNRFFSNIKYFSLNFNFCGGEVWWENQTLFEVIWELFTKWVVGALDGADWLSRLAKKPRTLAHWSITRTQEIHSLILLPEKL